VSDESTVGRGDEGGNDDSRPRVHGNHIVGAIALIFCGLALYWTTTFETAPPMLAKVMQAADFPRMVLGVMVVLSLVVIAQGMSIPDGKRRHQPPIVWLSIAAMIGFMILAEAVDLLLAVGVLYIVMSWIWGERNYPRLIGFGAALPVAIYVVFGILLEVRFPRGLITNLIYG
jgi:putative tricarboxylic transport membrane protein